MGPGSGSMHRGRNSPTTFCPPQRTVALPGPLRGQSAPLGGDLIGAAWLPARYYALPLSPNDDPSLAQESLGVVKDCQKRCLFQQPMQAHTRLNNCLQEGNEDYQNAS